MSFVQERVHTGCHIITSVKFIRNESFLSEFIGVFITERKTHSGRPFLPEQYKRGTALIFVWILCRSEEGIEKDRNWKALYHCVHNYASPQTAESQQSVQILVHKTLPLSEFLVAYWPIPNRNLNLTSRVILLTVVSSLLTEARLYEFSRHLEYYLWYTLANSPISFWNRLNPTFTMAGHFFWHPTSTIGTTIPPNTEIWSMSGAIRKIIDIF